LLRLACLTANKGSSAGKRYNVPAVLSILVLKQRIRAKVVLCLS